MILYNIPWVDALNISREAKRWLSSDIISGSQYTAIKTKFATPLYTPNLFIRIVLFLFTCLALTGFYGMAFLVVDSAGERGMSIVWTIAGLISFVALEALIKQKNLYKAGIDEALLYASLFLTIGGLIWLYLDLAAETKHWVIPWFIALPFLFWGVVRFANRLVTAAAYICVLGVIFTPLFETGSGARAFLPFVGMTVGVVSYILTHKCQDIDVLGPYKDCLYIVELLSLVTFYCSGNYYVVREMSVSLLDAPIPEGGDIPLAFLFYAFTALAPIGYIMRGLKVRDHLLLRVGLLSAVASVLTFRYYFHVIPPDVALTVAGLVLFLVAVGAIRHLKSSHNGYTEKDLLKEKLKGLDAEALLVSQTLGASPQPQSVEKKYEGGGGEFGGGGTSGNW